LCAFSLAGRQKSPFGAMRCDDRLLAEGVRSLSCEDGMGIEEHCFRRLASARAAPDHPFRAFRGLVDEALDVRRAIGGSVAERVGRYFVQPPRVPTPSPHSARCLNRCSRSHRLWARAAFCRRHREGGASITVPMWISRSWTAIVTMIARLPRCRHIPALMVPETVCKATRNHHRTWKSQ
jgi:hypothetical protein